MISLFGVSLLILGLSGLAALFFGRPRTSSAVGGLGCIAGCVTGIIPAMQVLLRDRALMFRAPWSLPYGALYLEADALSAFFMVIIFFVSALCAVYGAKTMAAMQRRRAVSLHWLFFNLLVASMVVVTAARNAVLFLIAWEVMSIASFFLVAFDDDHDSVRRAGWSYLIAAHLGTAVLAVFFILLARETGSTDFAPGSWSATPLRAGILFILAFVGFGTKAGFVPMHSWLPEAHPAAPSHVSALMSGVMIKMGVYGLLRTVMLLGPVQAWCGWLLLGAGMSSALIGILFAAAQDDVKRFLAYSSVENAGVIAVGVGLGITGMQADQPLVAVLGFAGALFHILNHSMFKPLLFLCSGALVHQTHTRRFDDLGGLMKKMPWTAAAFLTGAMAISGLPPFNGFASELLIFWGSFRSVMSDTPPAMPAAGAIIALALAGGLAAACFTKAFGIVFLGEPRRSATRDIHEASVSIRFPLIVLSFGCLAAGLGSPWILAVMGPVIRDVSGSVLDGNIITSLKSLTLAFSVLIAAVVLGLLLRKIALLRRPVKPAVTWDCGYERPSARMQYTAASFAQPLTDLFQWLLRTHKRVVRPAGYFPREASFESSTEDIFTRRVYHPLWKGLEWLLSRFRWLQQGHIQTYILYIALALLVLLIWGLQ